jgi:hypothetical protein
VGQLSGTKIRFCGNNSHPTQFPGPIASYLLLKSFHYPLNEMKRMKKLICGLLATTFLTTTLFAQDEIHGMLKAAVGYTSDFPGLNGYTVAGEYVLPVASHWDASLGAKYADMTGHPRTPSVDEFTRAKSLDFNFYWVPLRSDAQVVRIGLGYSFSFYTIQRAYPVYSQSDGKTSVSWPSQQATGRANGINFIVEYEYLLPSSPFSFGIRGALYKAYDRTWFIGPTVGYRW